MSEVHINPDRPPDGTYDPVDDVIIGARTIPGFIDVEKRMYYREWDVVFMFDDTLINERDAARHIQTLVDQFAPRWGEVIS